MNGESTDAEVREETKNRLRATLGKGLSVADCIAYVSDGGWDMRTVAEVLFELGGETADPKQVTSCGDCDFRHDWSGWGDPFSHCSAPGSDGLKIKHPLPLAPPEACPLRQGAVTIQLRLSARPALGAS